MEYDLGKARSDSPGIDDASSARETA